MLEVTTNRHKFKHICFTKQGFYIKMLDLVFHKLSPFRKAAHLPRVTP